MRSVDTRLAGLALSWLTTRPKRRSTPKALEAALWPFVEHRLGRAEWKAHHEALVAALLEEGEVQGYGRGGLELTTQGRTRALRFLGVESPRGLTWKKVKATHLQALSLGLNPSSKPTLAWLADGNGVRAALLKRQHSIEGKDTPTLAQVRDRLLWRQLGVETDRPFQLAAVQAHLLSQMLEVEVKNPRKAVEQLAARAVGIVRVEAEAVRLAALRGWLLPTSEPLPTPPKSSAPVAAPQAPAAPESVAERVLAVARSLPQERRFGPDKVFIAHVWRTLAPEWSSREAFNAALLEANRTRQLSLSRADLVSVMDPNDVAESEVSTSSARFHFVVV